MILENNFDMQIKKYVSWNVLKKSIGYKWKKQSIKSLIRYINSFARANILFCAGFFHTRKKFKNFSKEVIKSHLVDQIINNWLHFTKRLLVKFHRAYKSNDRLLDLHLLHQNIYKFCLQVPALY